jgi:TIR domain
MAETCVLDILILHSTRDRALAAGLAADFKAQGFTAGYDQGLIKRQNSQDETAARLRQATAVVVIWTSDSVASELVRADAGMAQDLGKLICVRVPDLAASRLPAGFWQARIFVLTERQALFRALREVIGDEAPPRAAPAPAPSRAPAQDLRRDALQSLRRRTESLDMPVQAKEASAQSRMPEAPDAQVKAGKLVENVPRIMRAGVGVEVEVRLSREETEALMAGLKGEVHRHNIMTTPAMTVTLQAPDGGFTIQSLSRETQWIDGSYSTQLGLLSQADYGCWKWIVTPLSSGKRRLNIVAAAKTSSGGVQAETPLPEQIVEVKVRVNYVRAIGGLVKWAAAAAAGGLVAEYASTLVKLAQAASAR